MMSSDLPEPWLRGTLADLPFAQRSAIHALQLGREDLEKWCGELSDEELNARPGGIEPVAFHVRHIARSIDRLLSYAEGKALGENQFDALRKELDSGATRREIFSDLTETLARAEGRIRAMDAGKLEETRWVGRRQLETTLGSLLVHVAEHTQRHVGEAIITAKIVRAGRMKETAAYSE
jgi:uncharacterized damage-inducible protein DinB